jgi:sec-independent protein translocase protein TatB
MTPLLLDIGTGELLAIIVLAVVLLGPEKVPALAKKAARILRFLRRVANTATDQVKAELGPDFDALKIDDLKPKNLVAKILPGEDEILPQSTQADMESLRAELEGMRTEVAKMQLQHGGRIHPVTAPSLVTAPPLTAVPSPVAVPSPEAVTSSSTPHEFPV